MLKDPAFKKNQLKLGAAGPINPSNGGRSASSVQKFDHFISKAWKTIKQQNMGVDFTSPTGNISSVNDDDELFKLYNQLIWYIQRKDVMLIN